MLLSVPSFRKFLLAARYRTPETLLHEMFLFVTSHAIEPFEGLKTDFTGIRSKDEGKRSY